jgi:hypothetical protein
MLTKPLHVPLQRKDAVNELLVWEKGEGRREKGEGRREKGEGKEKKLTKEHWQKGVRILAKKNKVTPELMALLP